MEWGLIIAGLGIGVLVGLTGMGGGSLLTPLLVLVFKFDPVAAIGTDILHGAIFKSFGSWRHRQLGTVHMPLVTWMALGSVPSSLMRSRQCHDVGARLMCLLLAMAIYMPSLHRYVSSWLTSATLCDCVHVRKQRSSAKSKREKSPFSVCSRSMML